MFAQETIKADEVARELDEARAAVGSAVDVRRFMTEAVQAYGGVVVPKNEVVKFDLRETSRAMRDAVGGMDGFEAVFEPPALEGTLHLSRTHPIVEGLAAHVADTALDPEAPGKARRAGAIRTSSVQRRTTLLLVRYRYHVRSHRGAEEEPMLAEQCVVLGFAGGPESPEWLPADQLESLLEAEPDANLLPEQAREFVQQAVEGLDRLGDPLTHDAQDRAAQLLDAHRRVREAARITGVRYEVEPQLPPDVLGVYVLLPIPAGVGS
jgi:hypothetical protein